MFIEYRVWKFEKCGTMGPILKQLNRRQVLHGKNRTTSSIPLLRLEMARELGLPPYVVFHDKTLKEMAILKPQSRTAMLQVTGIGEVKLERYGDLFLDVINEVT